MYAVITNSMYEIDKIVFRGSWDECVVFGEILQDDGIEYGIKFIR